MADYYTLLTDAGIAYETACKAAGVPIKLAQISVGDGNGAVYNPDASAKALKREVWRGPLNALFQDEKNANWLMAEVTIPSDVGGWYVREAGLWTDTGILYAIVKYPESYKPVLATSGSGKEFYIRSIFETSNAAIVTLLIDDTVVKATRAWVMDYLAKGTYSKAEIEALIAKASALPVGVMVPFPLGSVPPGYLEVDNSLFKDDVYPDLAAYLGKKFNLDGDARDHTRLPESRGEFFRGWDHGRAIDPGRSIGSYQKGSLVAIDNAADCVWGITVPSSANNLATTQSIAGLDSIAVTGDYVGAKLVYPNNVPVSTADLPGLAGNLGSAGVTRPRNLAVMWCIKAWNAPINQGNIDIAALVPFTSQSTEINQGTAKIATQPLTDTGTDDATIVTPKKMRFGFQFIKGVNGAIIFPTWLGGWIIQWGSTPEIPNATAATFNYTVPFPTAAICPGAFRRTQGNNSATVSTTLSQITINNRPHYTPDVSGTANLYYFFCFGY
ncbi:phage tail protein [Pseudomonas marginalis]|uniref:phage tail-collar fiber domain-containing protein n=1 Tax=Pseudomonas marginalis TaxID=298 RepID=UPI002033A7AB|nr:phage tail protein [Pseudomonas marginalis]MCM2376783.1 phage tail protein [Pseudomonas marginalis]